MAKGLPKNKAVSAITKFNTVTKLSLSAIINATQNVNTMTKAGVVRTAKAMFKSFTKSGKEQQNWLVFMMTLFCKKNQGLIWVKLLKRYFIRSKKLRILTEE